MGKNMGSWSPICVCGHTREEHEHGILGSECESPGCSCLEFKGDDEDDEEER